MRTRKLSVKTTTNKTERWSLNKVHSKFPWVHTDVNWIYKWQKIDKSFVQKIFKSCSSLSSRRWSLNSLQCGLLFLTFEEKRMERKKTRSMENLIHATSPGPAIQVSTTSDESCWQHVPLIVCDERVLYFWFFSQNLLFSLIMTKTLEKLHLNDSLLCTQSELLKTVKVIKHQKSQKCLSQEEPKKVWPANAVGERVASWNRGRTLGKNWNRDKVWM